MAKHKLGPKYWNVPFVDEVQEFNDAMGKPNNYEPTVGKKKEWQFVYDFILEELEEYKEACEKLEMTLEPKVLGVQQPMQK